MPSCMKKQIFLFSVCKDLQRENVWRKRGGAYQGWGLQSSTSDERQKQNKDSQWPTAMHSWRAPPLHPPSPHPQGPPPPGHDGHLLCVHVAPSQPSLQMQVKASPPPTHVPPFSHGPESHELFLAKKNRKSSFIIKYLQSERRRRAAFDSLRRTDLCCRRCPPSLKGSCTGRSRHGRSRCRRCCRCWRRTGSHLQVKNWNSEQLRRRRWWTRPVNGRLACTLGGQLLLLDWRWRLAVFCYKVEKFA